MKWLDLPPLWLALFVAFTWAVARALPQLTLGFVWLAPVAYALFAIGVGLMVLAAYQMNKFRTTIVPHRKPGALVNEGVFRLSRNPIYLGDMIVLIGAMIYWGVPLAIPLLWVFKRIIEKRFIEIEEDKLRAGFGAEFEDWANVTRRWL